MAPFLIFVILSLLSGSSAEVREHGLANEGPIAISPQAYAFFHPNAALQPSADSPSSSSTLPLAATVQSAPAHHSARQGSGGLGAGGIAGISLGFIFVGLIGMGVYFVMVKRRANLHKANPEQV